MYNGGKVIVGIAVFLAVMTSPIWYNFASGKGTYKPAPQLPVQDGQCVESTAYMRANHMNLLNTWRDEVVRNNQRTYTATDGKQYEKSFTKTCLKCHTDKAQFCDQCHTYAAVMPTCWSCHNTPEGSAQ